MSGRLGWGVVGSGSRAVDVMIPTLLSTPSAYVVGVSGRDFDKTKEKVAGWPEIEVFRNIGELVADDRVSVVYIASPHFLHVPQAVQAIDAGKHVFMESPMALSVDGANKLVEKAKIRGVRLGVAFQYRFHSALRDLRSKVAEGAIGKVRHVDAFSAEPGFIADGWWTNAAHSGPMALIRLGVHVIDLVSSLMNAQAEEVVALGAHQGENQLNSSLSAVLAYPDNVMSTIVAALEFGDQTQFIRVEGTDGRLVVEGDFNGGRTVILREVVEGNVKEIEYEPEDSVGKMVDAFIDSIERDRPFAPDGRDGKKVVEITCSIIESMAAKKAVRIGESPRQV